MDDRCWENAPVTDQFHVFKSGKAPKERTEVRVTYDSEKLCVFFLCHESQMGKVRATELRQEDGEAVIDAENVSWGAVGMIRRKLPKAGDGPARYTHDTDPIMQGKPFKLEPNELRPVWGDVYVPERTPAGSYTGRCQVILSENRTIPVDVSVRVYDFTLPEKSSLRVENWYNPQNVIYYYQQKDLPLEQFEKHAEFLARYRHPCFPFSWRFAPKKVRDRLETLDPAHELLDEYHSLLDLGPDVVRDLGHWTHDPQTLMVR